MKKLLCITIVFLLLFSTAACNSYHIYTNSESGYLFEIHNTEDVTISGSSLTAMLSDRVTVAVFSESAISYADPYYLTIYKENELDLHSGAFESNFNNTMYISQMIDYLFADSEKGYSAYAVRQSTFHSYPAWCADFTSEDDSVNGTIYIIVEYGKSYIVIIYVNDSYENRHHYDKTISHFVDSFEIFDTTEVK